MVEKELVAEQVVVVELQRRRKGEKKEKPIVLGLGCVWVRV